MVGVCVFTGHQGGERDSTRNTQWQRRCVGDEWRSALQVCSVTARGVFMAYSRPWCRLNNVSFPFTMTILKDQTRGWGRWKYTANSAQKRGCCFTVKALMLTLAPHPQAPSWDPSQLKSQVTLEFLCTCRGEGSSRSGFETLSQGTGKDRAGHGGAWTVFPQAQANENASKNASGRGWSFSSQCHLSWGQLSSS